MPTLWLLKPTIKHKNVHDYNRHKDNPLKHTLAGIQCTREHTATLCLDLQDIPHPLIKKIKININSEKQICPIENNCFLFWLSFENLIFLYPNELCWQKSHHLLAQGLSQTRWREVGCLSIRVCLWKHTLGCGEGERVGVWQRKGECRHDLALLASLESKGYRQAYSVSISVFVQQENNVKGLLKSKSMILYT